jgi:Type I phosphodiesterase / nucleotide pyrophosphatase
MSGDRRLLLVVGVAVLVALPAVALRAVCVGRSCERAEPARVRVPFCSLPPDVRRELAAGYRDGRSPDVIAVTERDVSVGSPPWPSTAGTGDVPLAIWGNAVAAEARAPTGTALDSVAPTLAAALGFERPHPEVRSGLAVPGAIQEGEPSRLAVIVVWKGVGTETLRSRPEAWSGLRRLLREGVGTLGAATGSAPLDSAALLDTLGTGGLPREHGITGTVLRNEDGAVVRAWGRDAPFSIIAALGDDLDERTGQAARIGLVGTEGTDRGLIGGNWYVGNDKDDVRIGGGSAEAQAEAAGALLASGYGSDEVPDLLAVVMEADLRAMDRSLVEVAQAALRAAGGRVTLAVTATGEVAADAIPEERVLAELQDRTGIPPEAVVGTAAGGLFVDPATLADSGVGEDDLVAALRDIRTPEGKRMFADAFSGFAVSLARYC